MQKKIKFIDLFAGCGGLSLGLMKAGLSGVFAIEKNKDAFSTLFHNLNAEKVKNGYKWPKWLTCENMTTSDLLSKYSNELRKLRRKKSSDDDA